MIDTAPKPLVPPNGVARQGVNPSNGPVLPPITLIKGQVIEGVVVQVQPRLLVETASSIFSAAISSAAYTLGERLLFKVVDPDLNPPRLELLRSGQLPDSSLGQQSAFLRSLLYRPNSLAPVQQWLSSHLSRAMLTPTLGVLLQEFLQLPLSLKALDIQKSLLKSGLFNESRSTANALSAKMMGPARASSDLKALLNLLALEDGMEQLVKPLLEALQSSQVKGLDAVLNNQVYYQWLMPWFEQQHLLITLQQSPQQRSQQQWSISLVHEGPELGHLGINLLLTQGKRVNETMASLHFSSNSEWLAPLVTSSKNQLIGALEGHGIYLHQVSVGPVTGPSSEEKSKTSHTILDIHV